MANEHQQPLFNKINAFDELMSNMQTPTLTPKPSESIAAMLRAQNFLQKIHDEAFKAGFEHGCDATKIIKGL